MGLFSSLWHRFFHHNLNDPFSLPDRFRNARPSLSFLEDLCQPLLLTDRYGFVRYVNGQFCSLWNHAPQDLVGQHFTVILSPAVHELDIRLFHEVISGVGSAGYQSMIVKKDGSARHVEYSASRLPVGRAVHVLLIFTDIHDLVQARNRQEQSQKELIDLYNASNAVLWEASAVTRTFRRIGASIEEITGYQTDEWTTPGFLDSLAESVSGRTESDFFDELMKIPMPATLELKINTHRFGTRWLQVEANRKPDSPAHVFSGLILDITARKSAEEVTQRLMAQLRHSNELKSEFLAQVSHELRTPVSIILGWIELLSHKNLSEDRRKEAYEYIEKNARMQIKLIDDLLDLARIEKGALRNRVEIVCINECMKSAIEAFQVAMHSKGIRLSANIPEGSVNVIGDQSRLTQIFWNLISNAIKFTDQGGAIVIDVEVFGEHVEIRIEDTGCGINPTFLPNIFDKFSREHPALKTHGHGLGLGLSIVKSLTETHGGTVSIASEGKDKGTLVSLRFPFVSREAVEIAKAPLVTTADDDASLDFLKDLRILVVDDVKDVTEVLKALLADKGAIVKACCSVSEAFKAFGEFKPQVVISDIAMPDESGIDLIQKIRSLSDEDGGDIPAAALTAFVKSITERQLLAAGFNKVLTKPISSAALYSSIRDLRHCESQPFH